MEDTYKFLEKIGITKTSESFASNKRFNAGGQYRLEVPGIQSPKVMKTLLLEAIKRDITLHRVTQTKGMMHRVNFGLAVLYF